MYLVADLNVEAQQYKGIVCVNVMLFVNTISIRDCYLLLFLACDLKMCCLNYTSVSTSIVSFLC